MLSSEVQDVIDNLLPGYYPDWQMTSMESGMWAKYLRYFDFGVVKAAIEKNYLVQKSNKKPNLGAVIEICKASIDRTQQRESNAPIEVYTIKQIGGKLSYTFADTPQNAGNSTLMTRKAQQDKERIEKSYRADFEIEFSNNVKFEIPF